MLNSVQWRCMRRVGAVLGAVIVWRVCRLVLSGRRTVAWHPSAPPPLIPHCVRLRPTICVALLFLTQHGDSL